MDAPNPEMNQTFRFSLTEGKFAELIVPAALTKEDIEIIKSLFEKIEKSSCS
ncbi:hypothetical protein [Bacillus sp. FSL M8-0168]|uniref:hypothetical protein n=1 Tax=Bacillus sp. FSL M8-0168 TaxID=2921614 RepID=UPI0030FDE080